jgi:hypothetical protein
MTRSMLTIIAGVAVLGGCSGATTPSQRDAGEPADASGLDASGNQDAAVVGCATPLAQWCCPENNSPTCLAQVTQAMTCGTWTNSPESPCGGYYAGDQNGGDGNTLWLYEMDAGTLIAVLRSGSSGPTECLGGPADLSVPGSCVQAWSDGTLIQPCVQRDAGTLVGYCQTLDGGGSD